MATVKGGKKICEAEAETSVLEKKSVKVKMTKLNPDPWSKVIDTNGVMVEMCYYKLVSVITDSSIDR